MAARYPLASSEFSDLIKAYPDDNLAGNSYFYLGEIDLRIQKPTDAIKQYDRLLERYPDNNKIPAARLHKGEALLATNKTSAGTVELKALIARYPQSPEAAQAKARLATLRAAR
jgi:tol-pal system protein YbgF